MVEQANSKDNGGRKQFCVEGCVDLRRLKISEGDQSGGRGNDAATCKSGAELLDCLFDCNLINRCRSMAWWYGVPMETLAVAPQQRQILQMTIWQPLSHKSHK